MNEDHLEDTHLCIRCNATILGLSKYIDHRKRNCLITGKQNASPKTDGRTRISADTHVSATLISSSNLDHSYDGFHFTEPEAPSSYLRKTAASHGGKTSKSLTEAYDLPYELGADLFFSSLQLQSVATGGKIGSVPRQERSKDESWSAPAGDPLLKAVRRTMKLSLSRFTLTMSTQKRVMRRMMRMNTRNLMRKKMRKSTMQGVTHRPLCPPVTQVVSGNQNSGRSYDIRI